MMKVILMENWQILMGIFTSIAAFFGGQKMKIIQEKKANSDAVLSMQTVYDNFVKDIEARYREIKDEMSGVKKELIELRAENLELRKQLKFWENKYNSLKKQFDKLTK